ncbi:helix-turn-helix domain-containing protein [Pseudomonas leptonychotis]|uniref:MerR family transcriptional regulator n=1 Tax=Pseudomonas leptonychotis TaxID=2448482 RepID=A0A4T1ZUP4_9PSED|nr:helix-turn-helix domain-containing protein [Pseudomonas leptonychotis]TIH07169.1 MerR family transcriptional regulator [Pseudomonas leptonychotis]
MKEIDIGKVSRRTGLPASTLRYYEEKGMIRSIGRNGLKRVFDESVIQRLTLIALGRGAGFALDEIASMLNAGTQPAIDRTQLQAKADELDRSIKHLSAIRDGLRHAASCPAENHLQCPKFQQLMSLAARTTARAKAKPAA